ncbi:MAG: hypothetical protein K2K08_00920 [Paramuribaculum sp.]|nr:hypothetical protein [Paramuribaculum sp.]
MRQQKVPWWIIALIILLVLPAAQFPVLLANCPAGPAIVRTLVWIYPFYVVVAAYLAYLCYPARRIITWILLALMVLTHVCVWLLVYSSINI